MYSTCITTVYTITLLYSLGLEVKCYISYNLFNYNDYYSKNTNVVNNDNMFFKKLSRGSIQGIACILSKASIQGTACILRIKMSSYKGRNGKNLSLWCELSHMRLRYEVITIHGNKILSKLQTLDMLQACQWKRWGGRTGPQQGIACSNLFYPSTLSYNKLYNWEIISNKSLSRTQFFYNG